MGKQDHRSTTVNEHFIRESVKRKHLAIIFWLITGDSSLSWHFEFSSLARIPRQSQLPARRMPYMVRAVHLGSVMPRKEPLMSQFSKPKMIKIFVGITGLFRRPNYRALSAILCLVMALALGNTRASADPTTAAQAKPIVSQYSPSFSSPGPCCSIEASNGGPLMGNGSLGVVVVNAINTVTSHRAWGPGSAIGQS